MPALAPGVVSYHVATKQVTHGDPTVEDNVAGIAIKQVEQSWTLGIANRAVVQIGEKFAIAHKGQVLVRTALVTAAKGDPIYIHTADNVLATSGGAGYMPFGRCVSVAGDSRGTPTGFLVCDLDARDSLA